jgi:hypothetical protein
MVHAFIFIEVCGVDVALYPIVDRGYGVSGSMHMHLFCCLKCVFVSFLMVL